MVPARRAPLAVPAAAEAQALVCPGAGEQGLVGWRKGPWQSFFLFPIRQQGCWISVLPCLALQENYPDSSLLLLFLSFLIKTEFRLV